jgi:hypothetical protein
MAGDDDSIFYNLPKVAGPLAAALPTQPAANAPRPAADPSFTMLAPEVQWRLDFAKQMVNNFSQKLANAQTPEQANFYRNQLQDHSEDINSLRQRLQDFGPKLVSSQGGGLPLSAPQMVAHPGYGGPTNLEQHLQRLRDTGILGGSSE